MNTKPPGTDTISLETSDLNLQFSRHGDRYHLRTLIGDNLIFDTHDGSDEEAWPAAPPLQQLYQQMLPTGPAVLGVGAAGRTHWSASFSVREAGLIWLEYAARVSRTWHPSDEWLGTSFRLATGWSLRPEESSWHLEGNGHSVQLLLLGEGSQVDVVNPAEFQLKPASEAANRGNTIEWKLALRLS